MTHRTGCWTAAALAAIASACLATVPAPEARGAPGGSQTGELGAGGNVLGDISTTAGEQDLVGIDLDAGAKLDVLLVADFDVKLALLDPHDVVQPVSFGPSPTTKSTIGFSVAESGRYHLRVSSADGTQGNYTLTAAERWRAKFAATLASGRSITFAMPAGASVTATVAAKPKKSWDPQIVSVKSALGGELLPAAIVGTNGVVRLPATTGPVTGIYALTVAGGAASAQFHAALTVSAPKVHRTHLDLRNGLTPVTPPPPSATISFSRDGVGQVFSNNCAGCHGWASNYSGVASQAGYALSLIEAGAMPLGGRRLPNAKVQLIQNWIATGLNP
jgi:hypothetical protein